MSITHQNPHHTRNLSYKQAYDSLSQEIEELGEDLDESELRRYAKRLDEIASGFIKDNMALLGNATRPYQGLKRYRIEDLDAAGAEILWEHFLTWDPAKGTFATWVHAALRGGIRREFVGNEHEELSYRTYLRRPEVLAAIATLQKELGRTPSDQEVAARTGETVELVANIRAPKAVRLDAPTAKDSNLHDLIAAPDMARIDDTELNDHYRQRLDDARQMFLEAEADLRDLDGKKPSVAKIAEKTGLPGELIAWIRANPEHPTDPGRNGSVDILPDLSDFTDWLRYLREVTEPLDLLELEFVLRRNGLTAAPAETVTSVAAATGLGREVVRRRHLTAHEQVRGPLPQLD